MTDIFGNPDNHSHGKPQAHKNYSIQIIELVTIFQLGILLVQIMLPLVRPRRSELSGALNLHPHRLKNQRE